MTGFFDSLKRQRPLPLPFIHLKILAFSLKNRSVLFSIW